MKIIVDPKQPLDFETSAGIGNFDGIHLGHKEIIEAAKTPLAGKFNTFLRNYIQSPSAESSRQKGAFSHLPVRVEVRDA